jgi:hypothetical protein
VPDGTTPPAEAVEAAYEALWQNQSAYDVAAAVVAALRLPERDRETAAKALDEAADEWQRDLEDEDSIRVARLIARQCPQCDDDPQETP